MKKIGVLAVVMAMAFLFVGVASAEMYVEGYIGGVMPTSNGQSFTVNEVPPLNTLSDVNHVRFGGGMDATVIGGVKLGTWFVPEGFAGYNYPSWMRYFGFYTDFSYQNLTMRPQRIGGTLTRNITAGPGIVRQELEAGFFESQGMAATWAFMFAGRYGFFADSEVPFGRLQPYVGVGPAIMFTSMSPKFGAQLVGGTANGLTGLHMSPGNQSSTNIALAVDAGIRYMALKNVSLDISFKYRYSPQSYTFSGVDNPGNGFNILTAGVPATFTLNPTYSLFSFQAGVAYHF